MRNFLIYILCLSDSAEYSDALMFHLKQVFPGSSCRLDQGGSSILEEAYSSSRNQYNSTAILRKITLATRHIEANRILAIVDVDLFVPSLNFVFGEAQCPGKYAIISTYRLKTHFYSKRNGSLFISRVKKEATHELGHTFGILHCVNAECVMFFSNSITDTDRKSENFCVECSRKILEALKCT